MITDELSINISADVGNAAQNITNTANALDGLGDSAKTADSDMSEFVKAMSDAATNMMSVSASIQTSVSGLTSFQSGLDGAVQSVTNLSTASSASATALNGIVSATGNFESRMDALSDTTHGTTVGMVQLQHTLNEALSSMRSFSDNMTDAGKDAADAAQHIRELSAQVKSMPTQQPLAIAEGFKKLKSIVMTLGIAKFVKDSNDAYETQMTNELKLTAHMKHRMNATDEEIKSIKELASAQQKIGVIGDEIQLAGAQQLTTYARQTSTLKSLIPAMNNLIAQNAGYDASAGDAKSAADMLGRALNGQYTSLKRMGVTFTKAQENVLKYGNEQQKAAVLADAINSKVGNMNELLAQTPIGQLKQLQNEFGDLQEEIGATFQPLISSLVPVLSSVLDSLKIPVINVSRGISVIGQTIAAIDSPVVRAIGLAAASIAVLNKLKLLIGGTSAGLLLLGLAVAAVTGSMVEQQDNIGDIVEDAYNSAQKSIGSATDAMSNFGDETAKTEKKLNRLANFDTITKLSGGSSSGIAEKILGDNWNTELNAAQVGIEDINSAIGDIPKSVGVDVKADISNALKGITDVRTLVENLLNAVGLDGTGFVTFWDNVIADFKKDWRLGLKDIDDAFRETFGSLGEAWSDYWGGFGTDLSEAVEGLKAWYSGDLAKAEAMAMKMNTSNPYLSEETRKSLDKTGDALIKGDMQAVRYESDQAMKNLSNDLTKTVDFWDEVNKHNILRPETYGLTYTKDIDKTEEAGSFLANTISEWQKYAVGFYTGKRDIFNQPIQTPTDYRSIQSTTDPAGVPVVNVEVNIDGEKADADERITIENGK